MEDVRTGNFNIFVDARTVQLRNNVFTAHSIAFN